MSLDEASKREVRAAQRRALVAETALGVAEEALTEACEALVGYERHGTLTRALAKVRRTLGRSTELPPELATRYRERRVAS